MRVLSYKGFGRALLFAWVLGIGSTLCAESEYLSEEELYGEEVLNGEGVSDPFEPINRMTFEFNDFVYLRVVDPIAKGYTAIIPDTVEVGVSNFFRNLKYPVRLAGNLLQGRIQGAWVETGRFAINSTVGIAGILTPADSVEGLEAIGAEDIGQALGSWGIGGGPYVVLPLLGPSNLRDLGGLIGDRTVNPLQEPFSLIDGWSWEWPVGVSGAGFVANSPSLIERYKLLLSDAIDPYGSLKNGYVQSRRGAIEE